MTSNLIKRKIAQEISLKMGSFFLHNESCILLCPQSQKHIGTKPFLVCKMGKIAFTIFTIFAQKNPICVTNLRVLKILVKCRSLHRKKYIHRLIELMNAMCHIFLKISIHSSTLSIQNARLFCFSTKLFNEFVLNFDQCLQSRSIYP